MACKCAPALITARNEYNACWPARDKSSDGCCPSPAHTKANPKSDHEPNAQGWSRAYDFDEDYTTGLGPSPLLPLIPLLLADPRTKYVIYEGVLYYPDGSTRKNKGHDKHLHLSVKNEAVLDTSPWGIARAFQSEEDNMAMTAEERLAFAREIAAEVWGTDISVPDGSGAFDAHALLGFTFTDAHATRALVAALAARPAGDVDEDALAAALVGGVSDSLARKILDGLADRLKT